MFRIKKIKIKKDKRRKGEKGGETYTYWIASFTFLTFAFKVSYYIMGFKNIDIEFQIKRGW